MRKPLKPQDQFIFSIYADDKKGLIGQILIHFNRADYAVNSLNVSRTDIRDLVLVTLEASVPERLIGPFSEKIKKIVEVYSVRTFAAGAGLKKTGFYRLSIEALNAEIWAVISRYGAVMSSIGFHGLVICKTGRDKDLDELYHLLEGPYLLGFCKSGLIMEESLVGFEELV